MAPAPPTAAAAVGISSFPDIACGGGTAGYEVSAMLLFLFGHGFGSSPVVAAAAPAPATGIWSEEDVRSEDGLLSFFQKASGLPSLRRRIQKNAQMAIAASSRIPSVTPTAIAVVCDFLEVLLVFAEERSAVGDDEGADDVGEVMVLKSEVVLLLPVVVGSGENRSVVLVNEDEEVLFAEVDVRVFVVLALVVVVALLVDVVEVESSPSPGPNKLLKNEAPSLNREPSPSCRGTNFGVGYGTGVI
jgi:hypothetical protein